MFFRLVFFGKTSNSLSGKDIKLSDRLFLPSSKLRGFESGKVGPKDGDDHIGGNYAAAINLETNLPNLLPENYNADAVLFLDLEISFEIENILASAFGVFKSSYKGKRISSEIFDRFFTGK